MLIGVLYLSLKLFETASLKDKRAVVRSLVDRTRHRFNAAVAEVGAQDDAGHAQIGITCVSNDAAHAHAMLMQILHFIEELHVDAEITDVETEVQRAF